ncbi:hypothetical protein ABB02_01657 [Clostridiaceae bacterium JG1575]|nr:hypothetical protein ABB02_01657 [Clostridiaceae bacterium JG1575]
MIEAVQLVLFSKEATKARDYLKKVLGLKFVHPPKAASDEAWTNFDLGPSEWAVHDEVTVYGDGKTFTAPHPFAMSLQVADFSAAYEQILARGGRFEEEPKDLGFGYGAMLCIPGAPSLLMFEPKKK